MLFLIQGFLEDYLVKRGFSDTDGYIVKLANVYYYRRYLLEQDVFLRKINKIKTTLYSNNRIQKRSDFERVILSRLDSKFLKEMPIVTKPTIRGQLISPIKAPPVSIYKILEEFKLFAQARVIDLFWKSRKKNQLVEGPEKIAQSLLATYFQGALNGKAIVVRELGCGIGYIDIAVVISSVLHIVELKILTNGFLGVEQLEEYMKIEQRSRGVLVVFDAMPPHKKVVFPSRITCKYGIIYVVGIDINPNPPSSLNILRH